jgi:hypothetical protein
MWLVLNLLFWETKSSPPAIAFRLPNTPFGSMTNHGVLMKSTLSAVGLYHALQKQGLGIINLYFYSSLK